MVIRRWFEVVILGGDELLKFNPNYGIALSWGILVPFTHRPSVFLNLEAVLYNLALPMMNKKNVRSARWGHA